MHFKRSSKTVNVTPVEAINGKDDGKPKGSEVAAPVDKVSINNSRNLPAVIDGLDKDQKERY